MMESNLTLWDWLMIIILMGIGEWYNRTKIISQIDIKKKEVEDGK